MSLSDATNSAVSSIQPKTSHSQFQVPISDVIEKQDDRITWHQRAPRVAPYGSLRSSQDSATSALRTFSIVEVAHLNFSWRGYLYAGAASKIHTIPDGLAGLRADEVLFELASVPGTHYQSFALRLDIELQGV